MNSKASIFLLFAFFTGVLNMGQAWVLAAAPPRIIRYAMVWIACSGLMAFVGRLSLWGTQQDNRGRGDSAELIAAAIISAIALLAGAWKAKRIAPGQPLMRTAGELTGPHFAVVLVGCSIAVGVIALFVLADADW